MFPFFPQDWMYQDWIQRLDIGYQDWIQFKYWIQRLDAKVIGFQSLWLSILVPHISESQHISSQIPQ